ncbi:MAG: TIGR00282 family metallophosphoesterase [Eubacteriaceae bacterium]
MRILILGDVYGRPGRTILKKEIFNLIKNNAIDFTIINGENASGGNGLTEKNARELLELPIDVITMGNHVWQQKDFTSSIEKFHQIVRPLNYPEPCPGNGLAFFEFKEKRICVLNLSGQIFMPSLDSPFKRIREVMTEVKEKSDIIIVDFHAEATSEKIAFGYYLDGFATAVYGTHTHVQTADERILPHGTAYITDLGMTGPLDGVIGVDKEIIIENMVSKRPVRFVTATGKIQINGIILDIDDKTCQAKDIKRIYEIYEG